jgi:hypothetical protein
METISITIEHPDIIGEDRLAEVIGVQKKKLFQDGGRQDYPSSRSNVPSFTS